jgi:hypothetical protein
MIALALSLVVDAVGAGLVWHFEHRVKGGDIHDLGDAAFFSTVQLLTVSSQIKNPLTTGGRVVDVLLEIWALFVVTTIAGVRCLLRLRRCLALDGDPGLGLAGRLPRRWPTSYPS